MHASSLSDSLVPRYYPGPAVCFVLNHCPPPPFKRYRNCLPSSVGIEALFTPPSGLALWHLLMSCSPRPSVLDERWGGTERRRWTREAGLLRQKCHCCCPKWHSMFAGVSSHPSKRRTETKIKSPGNSLVRYGAHASPANFPALLVCCVRTTMHGTQRTPSFLL
ncbi:hypothetical protein BV22DRAFT_842490 [Leucogyrophana mollusca]|uniref:Uncharacterized protein n=1 Tax=Leucogyrophana mollusca TaxID=85980 RepID=A0ACB8B528_9AGAM|nr:hypothetical protein BV22DRAFT_842490 [Leucogyrophana mollusca]